MDNVAYQLKCKELFQKAQEKGVRLDFPQDIFDPSRLDCLWYSGYVASIDVSDDLSIVIGIHGDVSLVLLDDKLQTELVEVYDNEEGLRFSKEMSSFIMDDEGLRKLTDCGRLIIDHNNWVEYDGEVMQDGTAFFVDMGLCDDNVLCYDILSAIEMALSDIDAIVANIKNRYAEIYKLPC